MKADLQEKKEGERNLSLPSLALFSRCTHTHSLSLSVSADVTALFSLPTSTVRVILPASCFDYMTPLLLLSQCLAYRESACVLACMHRHQRKRERMVQEVTVMTHADSAAAATHALYSNAKHAALPSSLPLSPSSLPTSSLPDYLNERVCLSLSLCASVPASAGEAGR